MILGVVFDYFKENCFYKVYSFIAITVWKRSHMSWNKMSIRFRYSVDVVCRKSYGFSEKTQSSNTYLGRETYIDNDYGVVYEYLAHEKRQRKSWNNEPE